MNKIKQIKVVKIEDVINKTYVNGKTEKNSKNEKKKIYET